MVTYIKENVLISERVKEISNIDCISLSQARLCCECDTIHKNSICVRCGSKQFISVNNIVKSLR